jgi:sodium/proline symporter
MAITTVKEIKSARRIGMGWMIFSLIGTIFTALIGLAYFAQNPNLKLTNPEAVFIELGQIFFHPLFAGFMLAAVLAAIMSTISSQLIVTSSALTEDLYKVLLKKDGTDKQYVFFGRMAVLAVAIIAAALAWVQNDTILDLVAYAWAGFGAAFGPIIILSLYWRKMTNWGAIWGMVAGAVTVIVWKNVGLGATMYEIVPGFIINLIVSVIVSYVTYRPNAEIEKEFDQSVKNLNS